MSCSLDLLLKAFDRDANLTHTLTRCGLASVVSAHLFCTSAPTGRLTHAITALIWASSLAALHNNMWVWVCRASMVPHTHTHTQLDGKASGDTHTHTHTHLDGKASGYTHTHRHSWMVKLQDTHTRTQLGGKASGWLPKKATLEVQGIGPCTSDMQSQRSTIWATPPDTRKAFVRWLMWSLEDHESVNTSCFVSLWYICLIEWQCAFRHHLWLFKCILFTSKHGSLTMSFCAFNVFKSFSWQKL